MTKTCISIYPYLYPREHLVEVLGRFLNKDQCFCYDKARQKYSKKNRGGGGSGGSATSSPRWACCSRTVRVIFIDNSVQHSFGNTSPKLFQAKNHFSTAERSSLWIIFCVWGHQLHELNDRTTKFGADDVDFLLR